MLLTVLDTHTGVSNMVENAIVETLLVQALSWLPHNPIAPSLALVMLTNTVERGIDWKCIKSVAQLSQVL